MIGKLLFHIVSGVLGLFLASRFVPGVEFFGNYKTLFITGAAIGLVNFLIKPALKAISLPLRIITLGLFGLIINMLMVWLIEIIFPENLEIIGIIPLFWTTVIIWALNFFFGLVSDKKHLS